MTWRTLRLASPLIVLALAIAAYAIYWNIVAARVAETVAAWRAAPGSWLAYDTMEVGGFPFRVVVSLTQARLRGADGELKATRLHAVAQPYDFSHWIFQAQGDQRLRIDGRTPDGGPRTVELAGTTGGTAASLLLDGGVAIRFDLDLRNFRGTLSDGAGPARPLEMTRAQGHIRRPQEAGAPAVIEVMAKGEGLRLGPGFAEALGPDIALVSVAGAMPLNGAGPGLDATAFAAALAGGERMRIEAAELRWGDVEVSATGALAIDRGRRPEGELDTRLGGHGALVDALVAERRLSAQDGALARQVLALLAAAGGDERGRVRVPLTLRDGGVFVGRTRIGELQPVF